MDSHGVSSNRYLEPKSQIDEDKGSRALLDVTLEYFLLILVPF